MSPTGRRSGNNNNTAATDNAISDSPLPASSAAMSVMDANNLNPTAKKKGWWTQSGAKLVETSILRPFLKPFFVTAECFEVVFYLRGHLYFILDPGSCLGNLQNQNCVATQKVLLYDRSGGRMGGVETKISRPNIHPPKQSLSLREIGQFALSSSIVLVCMVLLYNCCRQRRIVARRLKK